MISVPTCRATRTPMTDPMIVVVYVQVTGDDTLSVVAVVIEIASLSWIVEEVSFCEGVAGDTLSIVVMVETFFGDDTMSINDLVLVTLSLVVSGVGDCVTIAVFMIVSFLHTHMHGMQTLFTCLLTHDLCNLTTKTGFINSIDSVNSSTLY